MEMSFAAYACVLCNSVALQPGHMSYSATYHHATRVSARPGQTGSANYNANRRIIKQVTYTLDLVGLLDINKHLRSLPALTANIPLLRLSTFGSCFLQRGPAFRGETVDDSAVFVIVIGRWAGRVQREFVCVCKGERGISACIAVGF